MTQLKQIALIIETVCQSYSVNYEQLKSKSRVAPLPECRAVIWTICRHRFFKQTSYAYLGSLFNCCKHSAQKAIFKVNENWYLDYNAFSAKYGELIESVASKLNN